MCTCVATVPRFLSVLKELALSKHILSKKTGFCLQGMIILKNKNKNVKSITFLKCSDDYIFRLEFSRVSDA